MRVLKTSQCVDNCYFIVELIIVIFLASPNFPRSRPSLYNFAHSGVKLASYRIQRPMRLSSRDKSRDNISVVSSFYGFVTPHKIREFFTLRDIRWQNFKAICESHWNLFAMLSFIFSLYFYKDHFLNISWT